MRRTISKSLLFLSLVALLNVGAEAKSAKKGHSSTQISNPLVGAWKLVSLEEPGEDGQIHNTNCSGLFVFTRNGKASVQVMYSNAAAASTYAQGGYEASYGSYRINDSSTFTLHIDGAIMRTLIDRDLKRHYEIRRNRLTVKSTDPNEHWKVVWERY